MNEQISYSEEETVCLLNQFEGILESDPLIDEVGFIHPSQFAMLIEETSYSIPSSHSNLWQSADDIASFKRSNVDTSDYHVIRHFWNRDHKLGISSAILIPLYNAAKCAFMDAIRQYKVLRNPSDEFVVENSPCTLSSSDSVESDVLKHSRALILISCDFGTAWHSRKQVVSKKHLLQKYMDELQLSALVLSYSPKCEHAWSHRRWVIKLVSGKCSTLQDIVGNESELVQKIAERSKMNYRAWNHRCWLVHYMSTEQALCELKKLKHWAGLHVADYSCFHYRQLLLLRILEDTSPEKDNASSKYSVEIHELWKEELDWDEVLIKRYIGREALWLHRRFLSLIWMKHFSNNNDGASIDEELGIFVDNEFHLLSYCSTIPDIQFEDYQAQALYCTCYLLWLTKQVPEFYGVKFQAKLRTQDLKSLFSKVCPERSVLLDSFLETDEDLVIARVKA